MLVVVVVGVVVVVDVVVLLVSVVFEVSVLVAVVRPVVVVRSVLVAVVGMQTVETSVEVVVVVSSPPRALTSSSLFPVPLSWRYGRVFVVLENAVAVVEFDQPQHHQRAVWQFLKLDADLLVLFELEGRPVFEPAQVEDVRLWAAAVVGREHERLRRSPATQTVPVGLLQLTRPTRVKLARAGER